MSGSSRNGVSRRVLARWGAGLAGAPALAGLAGLAGCGTTQPGPGAASKPPAALRVSVDAETAKLGVGSFKDKYPHIAVTLEEQINTPGGQNWRQKNQAEWVAGTGPDMVAACCGQMPEWGRAGLFLNLDALIKRDGKQVPLADYSTDLLSTWKTPQHGQFALPSRAGIQVLYYSKSLFRREGVAPPDATWDWGKLQQAGQRFNRPEQNTWGWYVQLNFQRPAPFIRQNGAFQIDPKDAKKAAWDQPKALEALQWLHDRMWKEGQLVKPIDFTQIGVNAASPWLAVSSGKLAMLMDGSWSLAGWARGEPNLTDQWDIAVLPKGPAGKSTYQSSDGWAVWSGSKSQEQSWELLKFMQDKEFVELLVTQGARVPARKSMQDQFVPLMKKGFPQLADKNLAAFTDALKQEYAHAEQFFAAKDTEAKQVFTDAMTATFVRNEQGVADAFRAAAQKANALVSS